MAKRHYSKGKQERVASGHRWRARGSLSGRYKDERGFDQVELLNARGDSAIYWIPSAPEVRPGLKLRLRETGSEEWTVKQTFTTYPDVPPVPHRLGTPEPALSQSPL